jgi:hypothetical protein
VGLWIPFNIDIGLLLLFTRLCARFDVERRRQISTAIEA